MPMKVIRAARLRRISGVGFLCRQPGEGLSYEGSLAPKPSGGRRHAKTHRALLLEKVAEKADITMPERRLNSPPPPARRSPPPRFRVGSSALAIASKKTLRASEHDRPDIKQAREEWTSTRQPIIRLEPHRVVFLERRRHPSWLSPPAAATMAARAP
jgi:hypothetical protein